MTAKITFVQSRQKTEVPVQEQETILEAARRAGLVIESPCNGNGTCGKCKVRLADGSKVLACRETAREAMTVELLERHDSEGIQIKQSGQEIAVHVERFIEKKYLPETGQTAVYRDGTLIAYEQGDTSAASYGLVVDIGTTTLVVALIDLHTGKEIAATGALNPQSKFAQDVLSRITYASDEAGLKEMHRLFIDELNRLIVQISEEAGVFPVTIYEAVFSGNTCMLHLALQTDPSALGKYPYTPSIWGDQKVKAVDLALQIADYGEVFLPPIISAYVGADISSGVIAAQLAERKGISLFIDIGTNGEMILAVDGKLAATSTAAGPAFEGMNIVCGMRAAPGAIEKFRLEDSGRKKIQSIGNQPAIGICGSGLLDIVAELVKQKLVNPTGRLQQNAAQQFQDYLVKHEGKTVFQITKDVHLSQKDIRQVQLAKGAIRSGIEALLAHENRTADEVDRVLIAGSFGYHLNPESLLEIGLLPRAFAGKIEFLGNTSKTGGLAFLLSSQIRKKAAAITKKVTVIELANLQEYDQLFVKCLNF